MCVLNQQEGPLILPRRAPELLFWKGISDQGKSCATHFVVLSSKCEETILRQSICRSTRKGKVLSVEGAIMATAGRSVGGFMDAAYRLLIRRNSVYVTFVLTGAIVGERVINQCSSPISPLLSRPLLVFSSRSASGVLMSVKKERNLQKQEFHSIAMSGRFGILSIRSPVVSFFSLPNSLHGIETLISNNFGITLFCSFLSASFCSCWNWTCHGTYLFN